MGGFRTLKLLHFRRYLLWYYCLHFDVKYTAKHKTAIKHSTRVLTQFRTQSFAVSAISPNQVVQTLKLFYISDSHLKTFPSPFWWETKDGLPPRSAGGKVVAIGSLRRTGPVGPGAPRRPMPDEAELERRFNEVLLQMDLPPDRAKLLKSFDNAKKWDIICDREQVRSSALV